MKKRVVLKIVAYSAVLIALAFLGLVSVNYSIKVCDENFITGYSGLVSVLCQIVISVACCIVSVLGIAISLQNEKIYGISRRRFDKLRVGVHFSILGIIIVALLLSVLSIVAYSFDMYIMCIYFLILLVAFCFVACVCEIPIMCHREKSILNVVKKKLKMEMATGEDLSLDLKTVIKNIITEDYSIKKLYNIFKSRRNKKYNKELLIKLLEIHCDYAFELAKLDEGIKDKKAERLVENIKDILNFKEDFDVIQITDNEIWSYQHLITRVLFRTSEIESSRSKTVHLIFDSLPFIDHYKDKEHKRFVMSIIIKMISASLTTEDLGFAYELKRVCSSWQYSINKGGALTTVFALTSVHLEYLCISARNVTQEYKEQIRKFIQDTSVIEYCKTTSWSVLYSRFLEHFSLNVEEFLYYFKLNEDGWDMRIFDSHAHFVIMDEKYAIMWFLANLFSTHSVWNYDYNNLLSINSVFHGTLQHVGDQILNDESTQERMLRFVTFFLKDKDFKSFKLDEERNHRFETFVSNLHKKDIDKLIVETESIDTKELAKAYEVAVSDSLKKEWGYSEDFDLNETAPKFLKTMIEVKSFAMNYAEVLSDYLSSQIMFEIERSIPKTEIFYSRLSELKKSIDRQKKLYVAEIAKYDIQQLLSESDSEDKVEVVPFNSSILGGHYVLCNTPMKFGAEIKVRIENLTKQQVSEKAEEYKAQDGRYIYEGAFLSREELEGIIEKQYAILILELKYQVNGEELTVYMINYWDPDEKE